MIGFLNFFKYVIMEEAAAPFPATLFAYFEDDPDLQLRYEQLESFYVTAKNLGRQWNIDLFAQELRGIAEFVSEANVLARALLLGVWIEGDLMMVIGESLGPLLGLDQRSLYRYFNKIGWASTTIDDINCDQIRNAFGTQMLAAALWFKKKIHYRIYRGDQPEPRLTGGTWPDRHADEASGEPPAPAFNPAALFEDDRDVIAEVVSATTEFPDESPEPTQADPHFPFGDPDQATSPMPLRFQCRSDEIWVENPDESPEPTELDSDFASDDPNESIPPISPPFKGPSEEIFLEIRDDSPESMPLDSQLPSGDSDPSIRPMSPRFKGQSDEIQALEAIIQQRDRVIAEYEQRLNQMNDQFRAQMSEMSANLTLLEQRNKELTTRICASELERNKLIDKIMVKNEQLTVTMAKYRAWMRIQDRKIELLAQAQPELASEMETWAGSSARPCPPTLKLSTMTPEEKQILFMFYHEEDLKTVRGLTGLKSQAVFRILQTFMVPANSQLEHEIEVPPEWTIRADLLRDTARNSRHLFSEPVLQGFESCGNAQDLARILTQAFSDFSTIDNADWQQMARFVMDMAIGNVVCLNRQKSREQLAEQVSSLESTRGKLMHDCRQIKAWYEARLDDLQRQLSRTRRDLRKLEESIPDYTQEYFVDLRTVRPSRSAVRTEVFHEMVRLAQHEERHYTNHHYYMALLLLFRSRSSYEQIHTQFFPSPAPSSIYSHFHLQLDSSLRRLKSLDTVEPYLLGRILSEPQLLDGAVLAVDAVSCSSTFIGMKHVDKGKVAYLFVVYLQPLRPEVKCTPLFIIESESGMATTEVQKKIDEVLAIVEKTIPRVFLASDGDGSYNDRHHAFMALWEPIFRKSGFDEVLKFIQTYRGILPLSDLLHLAKNFRTRMLRYLLTFCDGNNSRSADPEVMRQILRLGAPLNDLTKVGKMRDAYPLVIARVDHINKLFDNDAIAEAVVWLPLCLCFNAIRLENITRGTRLFMLRVSWFMVWHIYERKRKRVDNCPQNPTKTTKLRLTIFTSQWSIRYLDTVLLFTFSIENYEIIALDRESTHPLENFFGFVRMDGHDVNTAEQMTKTIAHTDLVKEAMEKLELKDTVPGRVNLAGVRLGTDPPGKITYSVEMQNEMGPEQIALICLKAVHVVEGGLDVEEQIAFLQFRQYLTLLQRAADESRTNREINQRFGVSSGARIVHLIASHGSKQTP
jgi:hypothetical protein